MSDGSFSKNKWVLFAFLGFFGVIFAVNAVFIYSALSSQTGVVTEKPYEKGLAYNDTLQQAKNQPKINEKASYDNAVLRWLLRDEAGRHIKNAVVTARLVRSVKEGYDFDVEMAYKGDGVYEVSLDLPLKGAWVAQLESQWTHNKQNKMYKTTYQFVAK